MIRREEVEKAMQQKMDEAGIKSPREVTKCHEFCAAYVIRSYNAGRSGTAATVSCRHSQSVFSSCFLPDPFAYKKLGVHTYRKAG